MNRRGFLAGLCGAVAAVLGWPRKIESKPPLYYNPEDVSSVTWIGPWQDDGEVFVRGTTSDDVLFIGKDALYAWNGRTHTVRRIQ